MGPAGPVGPAGPAGPAAPGTPFWFHEIFFDPFGQLRYFVVIVIACDFATHA